MQVHRKRQFRFFLHRWHRRIGVVSALLVILLATTGVALNHTGGLRLDQYFPQNSLLLWPYDSVIAPMQGFDSSHGALLSSQGWLVYNEQRLTPCEQLLSATQNPDFILIACRQSWHLLSSQLQLIESFNPELLGFNSDSGPAVSVEPVLGVAGETLAVKDGRSWRVFNPDYLMLENEISGSVKTQPLSQFPAVNSSISLQRIVLDIHSGRWFGRWGVWMMDMAAIVLILLSISGLWLWWSRGRNRW